MLQPPAPKNEPERKLVRSITATCRRCKERVPMEDGYIVGKSYPFSHCGLVQVAKAPRI